MSNSKDLNDMISSMIRQLMEKKQLKVSSTQMPTKLQKALKQTVVQKPAPQDEGETESDIYSTSDDEVITINETSNTLKTESS